MNNLVQKEMEGRKALGHAKLSPQHSKADDSSHTLF